MKKPAILIVGEDEALRRSLKGLLLHKGFEVIQSPDRHHGFQYFQNANPDLVILGSSQDDARDALELCRQIRRRDRQVPVILATSHSSEELAIAALKTGVNDYVKHPFSFDELIASVNRCLSDLLPGESSANSDMRGPVLVEGEKMIGQSPPMREVRADIRKIASTDSNVLITGETGTGKELVAELIHRNSPRRQRPFVCINCAAIPDTLLESELFGYERGAFTGAHIAKEGALKLADGGTAFFDEIGDMSLYAQAKILRAIERKEVHRLGGSGSTPVNVRVIAATNQDLERLVEAGKFRQDLYYRLNVARLHLSRLCDRKEDIPPLLDHYIQEFNLRFGLKVQGFAEEALASLLRYDWPGNVRELKNLLEAVFVGSPSCRRISFTDLPEQFQKQLMNTERLPQDERDRLLSALFSTNWNKSKAAQKLHWSRMTLYRKMAKYQVTKTNPHDSVTSFSLDVTER